MHKNTTGFNAKVLVLISGLFLLSVAFLFYITPSTAQAHGWLGCPAEDEQFFCQCSGRNLVCTRTDAPGSCTLDSNFLDHRHLNDRLCSPGSIITIKQVDGTSGRSYDFTTSVIEHSTSEQAYTFSLSDGEEFEITDVIAGVYQITENLPQGVVVSDITCISDIEPPQINVDLNAASVTIFLRRLEDVECTFTNVEAIPGLENENQYKSDGITVIPEGDTNTEDTIVFKSNLTSFQNTDAKLQVELRQFNEPFTGSFDGGIIESDFVSSGQEASIARFGLVDGQYHWRARVIDENGNASNWQEFGTVGNVDFEVVVPIQVDIAVILAEPNNVPHESGQITAKPCKLISEKTYPNGHNIDYFNDLAFCVEDYHKENSFGKIDLNFEVFDNGGEWFKTDKKEEEYAGSQRQFVIDVMGLVEDSGVSFSGKDIMLVIHAGEGAKSRAESEEKFQAAAWLPDKALVSEDNLVGIWAHEIGHHIGVLATPENTMTPDIYQMGNVEQWDLMARGSNNDSGSNPPHMSSYTKEFLQWLHYDIHPKSAYGDYWINSLETTKLNGSILRYNLTDDASEETEKYYILEARNRDLKTWDSSLPGLTAKHLVLYYVDEKDFIVTIPGNNSDAGSQFNDGILSPSINETFRDIDSLVKFSATTDRFNDGSYEIQAKIEEMTGNSFSDKFWGAILRPNADFKEKINTSSEFFHPANATSPFPYTRAENFASNTGEIFEFLGFLSIIAIPISVVLMIISGIFIGLKKKFNWKQNKFIRISKKVFKIVWLTTLIFVALSLILYLAPRILEKTANFGQDIYTFSEVFNPVKTTYSWPTSRAERFVRSTEGPFEFLGFLSIIAIPISVVLMIISGIFIGLKKKFNWKQNKFIRISKKVFKIVWLTTLIFVALLAFRYITTYTLENFGKVEVEHGSGYAHISQPTHAPLLVPSISPDLDLHLYCDDGRHVGPNYETGEYDIQVADAIVSGDNPNSPEWIFVPQDTENCRFEVSARDNKVFLEENPEAGEGVEDLSDSYDIYARFIDPDTGIFTSSILEENIINPGETYIHHISGTSDVEVSDPVLEVEIRIEPQTLNLNQQRRFTVILNTGTAFNKSIEEIDIDSITLEEASPVSSNIVKGRNELRLTFNTQDLKDVEQGNSTILALSGNLLDGTEIEGSDTVRVIKKGRFFSGIFDLIRNLVAFIANAGF